MKTSRLMARFAFSMAMVLIASVSLPRWADASGSERTEVDVIAVSLEHLLLQLPEFSSAISGGKARVILVAPSESLGAYAGREVARRVGIRSGGVERSRVCDSGARSTCRLTPGIEAAMSVDGATIESDRATARVTVLYGVPEDRRQTLHSTTVVIRLDRGEAGWRVVSMDVAATT
jgi:hypothetical protein